MDVENVAVARPGGLTVFENNVKFRLLVFYGYCMDVSCTTVVCHP